KIKIAENNSRTIVPQFSVIVNYDIQGKKEDGETFSFLNIDLTKTVVLTSGEWSITISGKDKYNNVIAKGEKVITITDNQICETIINLYYCQNATGKVNLLINWLSEINVDSVLLQIDNGSEKELYTSGISINYIDNISSGSHIFKFKIKKNNKTIASVIESVHIYDYILTEKNIELKSEDFNRPPVSPSNLYCNESNGKIILSWTDNSKVETGFVIERSTSSGSDFTPIGETDISPLTSNTTVFEDITPITGVRYFYRIKAINNFGDSNYSNESDYKIVSKEVYDVTSINGLREIKISWKEPTEYDFNKVIITYDSKTIEISKGICEASIKGLNDSSEYTFTIKTSDSSNVLSNGVSKTAQTISPITDYFPYIGPYLTLISPTLETGTQTPTVLDSTSNIIINYESKADSSFSAKVFYRKSGATTWSEKIEDIYNELPTEMGKVHHITISQLIPDTVYEYQIISPSNSLSPIYTFKTSKINDNSCKYLIIGDQQDEESKQRWSDITTSIVNNHLDDFDFIISVGDMAKDDTEFNGDRYYWWKVFFDKGRELLARKVIFPTIGNHETPGNPGATNHKEEYWSNAEDTLSFRKYFYIKPDMTKPDYYSFNYGNSYFLSINSEIPVFYGRYPEKDTLNIRNSLSLWMQTTINGSGQSKAWTFAYSHVPPFNPSGGKDEVQYVRPYVEYFNQKVDWHISGHVHQYQRVRPLTAYSASHTFKKEYGRNNDQGVGYIVAPPSG
ncbi:MAG TPA: metallophosphoesterase, partial [Spirochaetota bacterium]|nr:metallophosphoesterase [Spirochaetota bacterium]